MAEFGGVRLVQNADSQMQKAEVLESIISNMVKKITEIDEEINIIIRGGITSDAVKDMLKTYLNNREAINDFIVRCSGIANALYESSVAMKQNETNASMAASDHV